MVKYQANNESAGYTPVHLLNSSSEEPNANQNTCIEVGFAVDNFNSNDQESRVVPLSSTTRPKRRCSQLWATNSSPQFLIEGPKPKPIKVDDVDYSRDMDYYSVDDLKAIARKRNLKGYYKLRKAELAKLLGITVTDGKRKRIKREIVAVVQKWPR